MMVVPYVAEASVWAELAVAWNSGDTVIMAFGEET
jgi:hypothetical protein